MQKYERLNQCEKLFQCHEWIFKADIKLIWQSNTKSAYSKRSISLSLLLMIIALSFFDVKVVEIKLRCSFSLSLKCSRRSQLQSSSLQQVSIQILVLNILTLFYARFKYKMYQIYQLLNELGKIWKELSWDSLVSAVKWQRDKHTNQRVSSSAFVN